MWKSYLRQFGGQPEGAPQSQTSIGNTTATFWRRQKRRLSFLRTKAPIDEKFTLRRTASLPEYGLLRNDDIRVALREYSGYISEPHSPSPTTPYKRNSTRSCFMDRPSTYMRNTKVDAGTVWHGQSIDRSGYLGEQCTSKRDRPFNCSTDYIQLGKSQPQISAASSEPLLGQIFGPALEIDDSHSIFDALDIDSHSLGATRGNHDGNVSQGKMRRSTSKQRKSFRPTCNKRLSRPWSADEDSRLRQHVQDNYSNDRIDWDKVGLRFNRSGVGCMTRYYHSA